MTNALRTAVVFCVLGSSALAQQDEPDPVLVLAERAHELFVRGDFARSASLLREAIAIRDDARLHYNLGRALQELGEWAAARTEYARFVELEPNTEERERVEARMQLLDERIRAEQVRIEAERRRLVEEQRRAEARRIEEQRRVASRSRAPWVVLGIGGASLVAGMAQGLRFNAEVDAARDAMDHEEAQPHARSADRLALGANITFGLGGAMTLIGLVWGLVDARSARRRVVSVDGARLRVDF